jgi:hypothetical protein
MTAALARACAASRADEILVGEWNVSFAYCARSDKFSVTVRVPDVGHGLPRWDPSCGGPGCGASVNANMCGVAPPVHPLAQMHTLQVVLGGYLAAYMGFGYVMTVDVPFTESLLTPAPGPRLQSAYARVRTGTPASPSALAAWLQDGFNTYTWPPFTFAITLPVAWGSSSAAETSYPISFQGGNMTLAGLADALNVLIEAVTLTIGGEAVPLPVHVTAVGCDDADACNAPGVDTGDVDAGGVVTSSGSGSGSGSGNSTSTNGNTGEALFSGRRRGEELGVMSDGFGLGSVGCGCGFDGADEDGGDVSRCGIGAGTGSTCRGLLRTQVRGLRFMWVGSMPTDTPVAFGLDWTMTPATMNPALVGYDAVKYGIATVHVPMREGAHIPSLAPPVCASARCRPLLGKVTVTYRPETGALAFGTTPFPPFEATVVGVEPQSGGTTSTTVYAVDTGAYRHGLGVGARVALTLATSTSPLSQQLCVVAAVPTNTDLLLVRQSDATAAAPNFTLADFVVVAPLDAPALSLYLQSTVSRKASVPPSPLGFRPTTYLAAVGGMVQIVTPGTVDLQADPFLYLALAFQAGDAAPMTGEIFVPVIHGAPPPGNSLTRVAAGGNISSRLIFAKIIRASCKYRPEYDKQFAFEFPGSGQNLGYLRVALYNSDMTPYLTHGHDVAVTLKCEAKMSGLAFGMSGCSRDGGEDAIIGLASLPMSMPMGGGMPAGMGPLGVIDPYTFPGANGAGYGPSMTPIPGHGTAFYGTNIMQ